VIKQPHPIASSHDPTTQLPSLANHTLITLCIRHRVSAAWAWLAWVMGMGTRSLKLGGVHYQESRLLPTNNTRDYEGVSLTVIVLRRPPPTAPPRHQAGFSLPRPRARWPRHIPMGASPRVESSGQKPLTWRDLGGVRSVGRL
jgi:hypothetical protein